MADLPGLIEGAHLLFPFARSVLASVTRDGGFPPLMLGLVDFAAMFQANIQNLEPAVQEGEDAPASPPANPAD